MPLLSFSETTLMYSNRLVIALSILTLCGACDRAPEEADEAATYEYAGVEASPPVEAAPEPAAPAPAERPGSADVVPAVEPTTPHHDLPADVSHASPVDPPAWATDENRRQKSELQGVSFSFIPPPDWHLKPDGAPNSVYIREHESTPIGVYDYGLLIQVAEQHGTLEEYVKEARQFSQGRAKVKSFHDEPFTSASGLVGHWITAETTEPGFQGRPAHAFRRTSYLFAGDGVRVSISASGPANRFDRYAETFRAVANSFRFE